MVEETIFPFEILKSELQLEITKSIKSEMIKYVVVAFCGDTEDQFYYFNKKDGSKGIIINHDFYVALVKYKTIFEKQNYYEWIKILEKSNLKENSYALASKLDFSTCRENLDPYRKILEDFLKPECFIAVEFLNIHLILKQAIL